MDDSDKPKDQDVDIRFLGDMQKLEWKPDDIGVIKYPGHLSMDAVVRIQEMCKRVLGEDHRFLILAEGMEFGVISDG